MCMFLRLLEVSWTVTPLSTIVTPPSLCTISRPSLDQKCVQHLYYGGHLTCAGMTSVQLCKRARGRGTNSAAKLKPRAALLYACPWGLVLSAPVSLSTSDSALYLPSLSFLSLASLASSAASAILSASAAAFWATNCRFREAAALIHISTMTSRMTPR